MLFQKNVDEFIKRIQLRASVLAWNAAYLKLEAILGTPKGCKG